MSAFLNMNAGRIRDPDNALRFHDGRLLGLEDGDSEVGEIRRGEGCDGGFQHLLICCFGIGC